jgi:hypothetical protein
LDFFGFFGDFLFFLTRSYHRIFSFQNNFHKIAKVHHPKINKIIDLLHKEKRKFPNFGKIKNKICGEKNHCESLSVGCFFSWRDFANFPQIYWENFGKYFFSIVNSTSFAKFFC